MRECSGNYDKVSEPCMRFVLQKHHLNGGKWQISHIQVGQEEVKYVRITIAQFYFLSTKQTTAGWQFLLNYCVAQHEQW